MLYYHFLIHQVIQVYVVWPEVSTNIPIPKVQLVAFSRQEFSIGEHRLVELLINPERYAVWGDSGWTFIKGSFFIRRSKSTIKQYNSSIEPHSHHDSGMLGSRAVFRGGGIGLWPPFGQKQFFDIEKKLENLVGPLYV